MKKIFFLATLLIILLSCGNNKKKTSDVLTVEDIGVWNRLGTIVM